MKYLRISVPKALYNTVGTEKRCVGDGNEAMQKKPQKKVKPLDGVDKFTDVLRDHILHTTSLRPYSRQKVLFEFHEVIKPTPPRAKRPKRDWSEYQFIRENQKLNFYKILNSVIDFLDFPKTVKSNGRPSADLRDIIKALCIKVYHNYSSWELLGELEIARSCRIIDRVYKKPTLNRYMASPLITPWLHKIYKTVASPLAELEFFWGTDATGMSSANRDRWINVRLEKKLHRSYQKLHIVSGTSTMIIGDALVTEGYKHESPLMKGMLDNTAKIFDIKEFTADAAYLSRKNCSAVESVGAVPFIALKSNTALGGGFSAWGRMLWSARNNSEWWLERYHRRSPVEGVFSMLKMKFSSYVRSKLEQARENEILCMVVCHNILVLATMMVTADIKPHFKEIKL